MVQSLADTAWRQNRIAALEEKLIELDTRALSNLSLHSQRLARQFEKTLLLLKEVQTPRLEDRERDLERAANLVQMHEDKDEPYDPSEDGFVFSNSAVQSFLSIRYRNLRATLAWDYLHRDEDEEEDEY